MEEGYKLSEQVKKTLMLSLQYCILTRTDMNNILDGLRFDVDLHNGEVFCLNPPTIVMPASGLVELADETETDLYDDEDEEEE